MLAVHEGLPAGLSTSNNEAGWQSSLARLATLRSCAGSCWRAGSSSRSWRARRSAGIAAVTATRGGTAIAPFRLHLLARSDNTSSPGLATPDMLVSVHRRGGALDDSPRSRRSQIRRRRRGSQGCGRARSARCRSDADDEDVLDDVVEEALNTLIVELAARCVEGGGAPAFEGKPVVVWGSRTLDTAAATVPKANRARTTVSG